VVHCFTESAQPCCGVLFVFCWLVINSLNPNADSEILVNDSTEIFIVLLFLTSICGLSFILSFHTWETNVGGNRPVKFLYFFGCRVKDIDPNAVTFGTFGNTKSSNFLSMTPTPQHYIVSGASFFSSFFASHLPAALSEFFVAFFYLMKSSELNVTITKR